MEQSPAERLGRILLDLPGGWPGSSEQAKPIKEEAARLKVEDDALRAIAARRATVAACETLSFDLIRLCRSENIVGSEKQMSLILECVDKLRKAME